MISFRFLYKETAAERVSFFMKKNEEVLNIHEQKCCELLPYNTGRKGGDK